MTDTLNDWRAEFENWLGINVDAIEVGSTAHAQLHAFKAAWNIRPSEISDTGLREVIAKAFEEFENGPPSPETNGMDIYDLIAARVQPHLKRELEKQRKSSLAVFIDKAGLYEFRATSFYPEGSTTVVEEQKLPFTYIEGATQRESCWVPVPDEDVEVAIAEAIAVMEPKTDYCEKGIPVLKDLKKYGWRVMQEK